MVRTRAAPPGIVGGAAWRTSARGPLGSS